ncbi:phosphatidylinositol-glycan biosynthesis class W protein-like isoform X2 [Gigantopelta aegis]|uniref:phosphatidylinositol-glycan biosynthesis class W protein-like isoform X2 n=1 Tax=Gigantopelta aegis TaxID=1735272 RepID=UPI001B88A26A|nr:phosphatidylinositol-glycan biosynthesis class W protein-like isoform X2 [Gigantopelta aegis]
MSYKSIHEQFVSGLNGTTLSEVSVQTAFGAASIFLRDTSFLLFGVHSSKIDCWFQLALDFTLLVVPVLLAQTVLSDVSTQLLIALCVCSLLTIPACIKQFYKNVNNSNQLSATSLLSTEMGMVRPFITNTRSFVLIATAIAILAVDFKIFPRRLAKTETFGSGLMDIGVGLFVFTNAIVSPEARGRHTHISCFVNKCVAIIQSLKASLPLLILGLARMLAVKGANYQEHITEYGVHWNFFITLAVTKVLSTILFVIVDPMWSGPLSVVLAVFYQYWLSTCGLSQYIQLGLDGRGGRSGLIDANREGIYSCVGYLAIYLAGVLTGRFLFKKRTKLCDWLWFFVTLTTISTILWCLLSYCVTAVQPISRRMANTTYVMWIVALGIFLVCTFLLEDLIITGLKSIVQFQILNLF